MNFLINCDEATTICNKNQYEEASLWEKMRLMIHLFICKNCGQYSKQNATLTKVCDKHLHKNKKEHKFSGKEKETLQKKVDERIE